MIYSIKPLNGSPDVIDLDISVMAEKLKSHAPEGMDVMRYLYMLPFTNTRLSDLWPEDGIQCSFFSDSKETYKDIHQYSSFLVLTERAYDFLKSSMQEYGEFLKLDVDGVAMRLFNPHCFISDDLEDCEKEYFEGEEVGIKSLKFADKASENLIFKSKYTAASSMYCNDNFKKLIEDLALEGLVFDEDINNIY